MNSSSGFSKISKAVYAVVNDWHSKLLALPANVITDRKNSQHRTIKMILGHLIDSASNNHQRIVRLHYKRDLIFPDYRQDNDTWITIQNYQEEDWYTMVNLWKFYNLHLSHVFNFIDDECLDHTWKDFENQPVTLSQMIEGYLSHLNLHLDEITELIKQ